jgi:hypothetical protein
MRRKAKWERLSRTFGGMQEETGKAIDGCNDAGGVADDVVGDSGVISEVEILPCLKSLRNKEMMGEGSVLLQKISPTR